MCVCVTGHQSHVSQCPPNEFECRGTDVCIHLSKVCNGISDCVDGRDEGHHCLGNCSFIHSHTHTYLSQNDPEIRLSQAHKELKNLSAPPSVLLMSCLHYHRPLLRPAPQTEPTPIKSPALIGVRGGTQSSPEVYCSAAVIKKKTK